MIFAEGILIAQYFCRRAAGSPPFVLRTSPYNTNFKSISVYTTI